jgi:uncharacterized protein (TIGR04222 family)
MLYCRHLQADEEVPTIGQCRPALERRYTGNRTTLSRSDRHRQIHGPSSPDESVVNTLIMPTTFNMNFLTITCGVMFVVALYLTLVWRAFMARRVWRAGATMHITKVSAYQMALMEGGASRVALTAVVRLLGRKVLAAGIAGVLVPGEESADAPDLVEREALAVARKPALFREFLILLEMQLKRNGVTAQLRNELITMGYMRARGSKAWWANYAANMLPFAVLVGITLGAMLGFAITTDARNGLIGFSACSIAVMLIVALPRRVTALGKYIVWSATQHHPDLKTARATHGETLDIKRLGQSVALYGPDALAGSDLAWIPAVLRSTEPSD